MRSWLLSICAVLAAGVVGGVLFLGFYDWPAPADPMVIVIPNDRLSLQ